MKPLPLEPVSYGALRVPFTTMWSEEAEQRAPRAITWRWRGHEGIYVSDGASRPGAGKPIFKKVHGDRARHLMRAEACQMCVRPLPAIRICTVTGTTAYEARYRQPVVVDGLPMCPACAAEAYRACPALPRQHAEGKLRIFEVRPDDYVPLPKLLRVIEDPGADPRVNEIIRRSQRPVLGGPDLVLVNARRISVEELLARAPIPESAHGK